MLSIAGRIMTKRGKGKAGFAHIQDLKVKFKFMFVKMLLEKKRMNYLTTADLGDIVGIRR